MFNICEKYTWTYNLRRKKYVKYNFIFSDSNWCVLRRYFDIVYWQLGFGTTLKRQTDITKQESTETFYMFLWKVINIWCFYLNIVFWFYWWTWYLCCFFLQLLNAEYLLISFSQILKKKYPWLRLIIGTHYTVLTKFQILFSVDSIQHFLRFSIGIQHVITNSLYSFSLANY